MKRCKVRGDVHRSHFEYAELFVEVKEDKSQHTPKNPLTTDRASGRRLISKYEGKSGKEFVIEVIGQIVSSCNCADPQANCLTKPRDRLGAIGVDLGPGYRNLLRNT